MSATIAVASFFLWQLAAATSSPEQIHISLAGSQGIAVAWFTLDQPNPAPLSVVQYGLSSDLLSFVAQSVSPATAYLKGHGFHHHVILQNLTFNTEYFYHVGDTLGLVWSEVFRFTSGPDNHAPFSVAIFGDMGYLGSAERPKVIFDIAGLEKNWSAVPSRDRLEEWKNAGEIDWIWHIGDIGYADDSFAEDPLEFEYEKCYNGFMNWIQNLTSLMPYMVLPGNHESECHSPVCIVEEKYHALSNFSAFNARWHMPSSFSGGVASMWYSFDYGLSHFVAMNSETDYPGAPEEHRDVLPAGGFAPNGTYLAWLENDLRIASEARASRAPGYRPWLIVAGHRPYGEIKGNGVDALFAKYGVDMYFAGHVHSYSRSLPTALGVVDRQSVVTLNHYHDPQGTVFIVSGGAGCDEMNYVAEGVTMPHDHAHAHAHHETVPDEVLPFGSEVEDVSTDRLSIGRLEVVNATAVHWVLYASVDGEILDELWVTKSPMSTRPLPTHVTQHTTQHTTQNTHNTLRGDPHSQAMLPQ